MNRKLITFVGIVATSLWSMANASTVTYTFSGGSGTINNSTYTPTPTSGSGQPITIAGEAVGSNGNNASPGDGKSPDDGGPGAFTGTTQLFSVTNGSGGNTATGIAPYISTEGTFVNQNGITEYDALLINLTGVTTGSTVQFVMSTGSNAAADTGFNLWSGSGDTSAPTGLGTGGTGLGTESMTGVDINGAGGGAKTSSTYTFTTSLAANTYIAIQADCHYLLLDQIIITTPSGVPEPSFYGFFALAMVGLVFGARKMRARAAVAAASEQA